MMIELHVCNIVSLLHDMII